MTVTQPLPPMFPHTPAPMGNTLNPRNAPVAMTHIVSYGYEVGVPIFSKKTQRYRLIRIAVGFVVFLLYLSLVHKHLGVFLLLFGLFATLCLIKFFGRKVVTNTKELLIFTRYVIVGGEIIYYQSVQSMYIDERNGNLVLSFQAGNATTPRQLVISRNRLKTVTTKTEKKKLRQQEKFSKLYQDLRQLIIVANPQARISFA